MDMDNYYLNTMCCILCRSEKGKRQFNSVYNIKVPSSKRPVKYVLQHLAKCIKSELNIPKTAHVCQSCYEMLVEYDKVMLKLLNIQTQLTKMIQKSVAINDSESIDVVLQDEIVSNTEGMQDISEAEISSICEGSNQDFSVNSESIWKKTFHCTLCDKKYDSEEELQIHFNKHHISQLHTCGMCDTVCKSEEYLTLHMNIHEGKTENECRYCPKKYSKKTNVIRHMQKHWNKNNFQCEKCGLCFSQSNVLYNHKLLHEAEEQPLVCNVCNQSFKTRKTYRHHIVTHREDRPRYNCELCRKSFTEKYTLKMHLKTHKDAKEKHSNDKARKFSQIHELKLVQCIICGSTYIRRDQLENHMEKEHDVILNSFYSSEYRDK